MWISSTDWLEPVATRQSVGPTSSRIASLLQDPKQTLPFPVHMHLPICLHILAAPLAHDNPLSSKTIPTGGGHSATFFGGLSLYLADQECQEHLIFETALRVASTSL